MSEGARRTAEIVNGLRRFSVIDREERTRVGRVGAQPRSAQIEPAAARAGLTGTMQHAHFPSHIGANAARLILTVLPPHGLLMLLAHSLHVAEVQNLPEVWPKRAPRLKDILLRACDDSDDESRGAVLAFLQLLRARDPRISAYRQRLTVTHEPTQGRNELCRCGSGKKFKRCCLLH